MHAVTLNPARPSPKAVPGLGSARIRRIERRAFEGDSDSASDPDLRRYLTDLVAPYGLALREELLEAGRGHSYAEMTEALVRLMASDAAPLDLIVLAHAMPDVQPGRSTANYLSHICPGRPPAFAVCDQGSAAPFTALSVALSYLEHGGCRNALVLVVEQSALHYTAVDAPIPRGHTAVAILLDGAGAIRVSRPELHTDVAAHQVAARLTEVVAARPGATVILGGDLGARVGTALAGAPRAAPAGRPCTGPWWELAAGLAAPARDPRRVVLADYDPALRYLCVLDAEPAEG